VKRRGEKTTHLCLGSNDLALTNALALSSHAQRLLEFLAKDHVLDEHALDLHAPVAGHILNDLADALGHLLAALNHILQHAGTNNMTQGRLRPLHQRLAHIRHAKGRLVRRHHAVVNHRVDLQRHIVLGDARLQRHLDNLDLDVHLDQALRQRVNLDQTRVNGLVEAAKLGDEPDVALLHALVGVRAADAARDGAQGADDGADGVDHGAVPARVVGVVDDGGIAPLKVFLPRRFHFHVLVGPESGGGGAVLVGAPRVGEVGDRGLALGVLERGGHGHRWWRGRMVVMLGVGVG
jgi:hypothetical protein